MNRNLFNQELHPYIIPGRWLAAILSKKSGLRFINFLLRLQKGKSTSELDCKEIFISRTDETSKIRTQIFKPKDHKGPLPVMFYFHGGGFMTGIPEGSLEIIKDYIQTRPCIVIAPDYRKSLQLPYPAAFNDCYETILWTKANAQNLDIDIKKVILAGNSAGGGLVAAISLKLRESKAIKIAFQMPIYPMLDHRQKSQSAKAYVDTPVWNSKINAFAWKLYLRDLQEEIPYFASPLLHPDFSDLPPTISMVSEYEPFRDEVLEYMRGLKNAGISTKFELFKGAFHGFDVVAPKTEIAKKAVAFQLNSYAEFYDTYL